MSKVVITLPDGATREFEKDSSALDIAKNIAPSLAKATLVAKIDGELRDLSTVIAKDCRLEFINREHDDALEILRHDCAHVLAEAVQSLFPNTQITFGPSIENGLYYDFYRETPFTPDDFPAIEKKMCEIIDQNQPFTREVWQRDEAAAFFKKQGETFKAEHVMRLPEGEDISIYRQGDWLDLCRGPHMPSTGRLGKAFKLMRVSGAYWLGDQNNPQLQRIYATCWRNEKELNAYLTFLEEAEKRDHRKLGRQMALFHTQEEAAGSIFWHRDGYRVYRILENYIRNRLHQDYDEVKTPQMVSNSLWKQSGHWEKFGDDMFTVNENEIDNDALQRIFALKPMNCPCHVQVYNQNITSYKDLPVRLAEFGQVHRNEASGALHGLMRVRAFTQDDGHIFCTEEQVIAETKKFCALLKSIYQDCGFSDFSIKFSDRPEVRAGEDEVWDKAEASLKEAIDAADMPYVMNPGEGAFYGPKLEFVLKDTLGREWQCGTWQVDFVLPKRLGATYIDANGEKQVPVMLHRAILGSMERFIGILLEHHAGHLPFWLSPTQVKICTITNDLDEYGEKVLQEFTKAGLRAESDFRSEKINYKIREHSVKKIPLLIICGKKEAENNQVTLRFLGKKEQETLDLNVALQQLRQQSIIPKFAEILPSGLV